MARVTAFSAPLRTRAQRANAAKLEQTASGTSGQKINLPTVGGAARGGLIAAEYFGKNRKNNALQLLVQALRAAAWIPHVHADINLSKQF